MKWKKFFGYAYSCVWDMFSCKISNNYGITFFNPVVYFRENQCWKFFKRMHKYLIDSKDHFYFGNWFSQKWSSVWKKVSIQFQPVGDAVFIYILRSHARGTIAA